MAGPHSGRRALIVEDEAPIRELVRFHLALAGFAVDEVADGRSALGRLKADTFDLILLDLMLPGLDGVTLCRAVREDSANRGTAILMLTARDTESDKVLGLESGADDYLTKPFGVRELMARVTAILRRESRAAAAGPEPRHTQRVSSRGVSLDGERRRAVVRGAEVDLTKQEFDLLFLLVERPGIVFERSSLLSKVWDADVYVTERTVDAVVSRLRRKVERDPHNPELILTEWGVGYKFADAEA
jgi:DNA-binding response OmpR family regulator